MLSITLKLKSYQLTLMHQCYITSMRRLRIVDLLLTNLTQAGTSNTRVMKALLCFIGPITPSHVNTTRAVITSLCCI